VLGPDGRVAARFAIPGALPRPADWRASPDYRQTVEQVAAALDRALEPAT